MNYHLSWYGNELANWRECQSTPISIIQAGLPGWMMDIGRIGVIHCGRCINQTSKNAATPKSGSPTNTARPTSTRSGVTGVCASCWVKMAVAATSDVAENGASVTGARVGVAFEVGVDAGVAGGKVTKRAASGDSTPGAKVAVSVAAGAASVISSTGVCVGDGTVCCCGCAGRTTMVSALATEPPGPLPVSW